MKPAFLPDVLDILLYQEEEMRNIIAENADTQQLNSVQKNICLHVRQVTQTGDLARMIAMERTILEGDLERYANSQAMKSSLKNALQEFEVIEQSLPTKQNTRLSMPPTRCPNTAKMVCPKTRHARPSNPISPVCPIWTNPVCRIPKKP